MASIQSSEQNEEPKLDLVLLYLLGKEFDRRGDGFKIPTSKIHELVYAIDNELEEFGIRLKFHESVGDVHSQQVEEALENLIPYLIPVSNPSFSLNIYDEVGENALKRAEGRLSDEQKQELNHLIEDEDYRQTLEQYIRNNGGD